LAGCTSSDPDTYLNDKYHQDFVVDSTDGTTAIAHPADDEDLEFTVDTETGNDDYAARKMGKYFTTVLSTHLGRNGVSAAVRVAVPWPAGLSYNADWKIQDYISEVKPESIDVEVIYNKDIQEAQVRELLTQLATQFEVPMNIRAQTTPDTDLNPCYDYLVVSATVDDAETAAKCNSETAWEAELRPES
jgi:hypothetical protein